MKSMTDVGMEWMFVHESHSCVVRFPDTMECELEHYQCLWCEAHHTSQDFYFKISETAFGRIFLVTH